MRKLGLGLAALVCACGGSNVDISDDGGAEASVDAPTKVDAAPDVVDVPDVAVEAGPYGQPSTTYPAFTPWMGQLSKNGGPILSAPNVVTITWDNDTGRSTFEAFADGLGASAYWSSAVSEWGVGATTSVHVHVTTTAPSTMSDADVQNFIKTNLGVLLPANTAQTIYLVYTSPSTTFTFGGGNACSSIGGYHDNFVYNTQSISYAVVPHCGSATAATSYASHEIGEASTDPQPSTNPGVDGFDDPYLAFYEWQRNNEENGDACEFFKDSFFTSPSPFAYNVQRLWSNVQGPLGHSPCQPYTGVYFNVAPLDIQNVTVDLSGSGGPKAFATQGYKCALNDSIQIPIGFYSDGATGPWTVSVAESNPLVNPVTGRLQLSVDTAKTSGVNGEKTYINVKVIANPIGLELMTIISTQGSVNHYLPLIIASN